MKKTLQIAKLLFYCVHHEIVDRSTAKLSKSVISKWSIAPAILPKQLKLEAELGMLRCRAQVYHYFLLLRRNANLL
jgi:hypothetical protein